MQLLVREIMSKNLIKLKKSNTLVEVAQIFLKRLIDGAPVVDDHGKVIGIFTKTHLIRAMAMGTSIDKTIERIMEKNIITINEKMPALEALSIPVGRLPVVNEAGALVGWLTRTDLANAFYTNCQPYMVDLLPSLSSTSVGVVLTNEKGIINTCNQAAEQIWGQQRKNFVGRPAEKTFPTRKISQVISSGKPETEILTVNQAKIVGQYSPILDNDQLSGTVLVFTDISGLIN